MESKGLAGCKHHAVKSWAQTQTSSELPPPASPVSPSSRSAIKQSFRDFSFITQHFCVGFNTFFKQRWSSFSSDTLTWLFPVNPFIVFLFFFFFVGQYTLIHVIFHWLMLSGFICVTLLYAVIQTELGLSSVCTLWIHFLFSWLYFSVLSSCLVIILSFFPISYVCGCILQRHQG